MAEFLSVAINLAELSGNIIREVWRSDDIGRKDKENDKGPVTIADLRVQRNIEFNLKQIYPELEVRGEEDPSMYAMYEPTIKPSEVVKDLIKQEVLNEHHVKRAEYLE